jgi:hypothetical protein
MSLAFGLGESVWIALVLLALSSCASLSHDSRNQYVLVRSKPEGIPIYSEGQKIGTTPAYIEVARARSKEIELRSQEETKRVLVPSSYDWGGSFFGNFAFLVAAPLGWVVDLISGSAWKLSDPPLADIRATKQELEKKKVVVAVAPPSSNSMTTSDAVGVLWGKKLERQYPGVQFLPYEQTLPVFTSHGYDFDDEPSLEGEHRIYGLLGAGMLFESEIEETNKGMRLTGKFHDIYTGREGSKHLLEVEPKKDGEQKASWYEGWKSWYNLIPNTIGMDWSNAQLQLMSGAAAYDSQFPTGSSFGDKVLNFLDSVMFTHLDPPRMNAPSRFVFSLNPDFRISYRTIAFPGYPAFQNTLFYYFELDGGYGPELGWQSGPHYIYVNFMPTFGLHKLNWSSNSISVGAFSSTVEVGYLYFLSQSLSMRFYTNTNTSTNATVWNAALQSLAPGSPPITSISEWVAGFALAYTFQPERHISDWQELGRAPAF